MVQGWVGLGSRSRLVFSHGMVVVKVGSGVGWSRFRIDGGLQPGCGSGGGGSGKGGAGGICVDQRRSSEDTNDARVGNDVNGKWTAR